MFDLAIRGGRVVTPDATTVADVGIRDGAIEQIGVAIPAAKTEIDASGLLVLSGLIDVHVHFNQPGREDWEGAATGSRALAAGGGTLFFDMPLNSTPCVVNAREFDRKCAALAAHSIADFGIWGGLIPGNIAHLPEMAGRGAVGFKAFLCDRARLSSQLDALARISEAEPPVVTRVVFTPTDLRARAFVKRLCEEAGLAVRKDAVGNTFARWLGADPDLPAVATGSHIDAVPNAGRFDGTVGVLGAIEAIRALQHSGFRPRRSIELIVFTAEEPTRFGIGCLGSRFMAGTLEESAGRSLLDRDGTCLDQVRSAAGFSGSLDSVRIEPGHFSAFVELHIEQGPLLEQQEKDIGVVTSIAAPAGFRLWIEGEGGHAGAVLMPGRRDAFAAAAEMTLAIESAAKSSGAIDTVATVGVCDLFPRAINSIPSRVMMEVDVRDVNEPRRDFVVSCIQTAIETIAARRRVDLRTEVLNSDPPGTCDPQIVHIIEESAEEHALTAMRLISRAYHDSLFMSRVSPMAMLFIPCQGGISHRPDEYSTPDAIASGAAVLARALAQLSDL
jgi:ureidoglycolate amidohydrolase